jgi:transcriptional regulator with XRE-family HTH domain
MEDPIPESIATTISSGISTVKAYRMHARASLEAIALKADISVTRLLMIEAGMPSSPDELSAIAKALGISVQALGFLEFRPRAAA